VRLFRARARVFVVAEDSVRLRFIVFRPCAYHLSSIQTPSRLRCSLCVRSPRLFPVIFVCHCDFDHFDIGCRNRTLRDGGSHALETGQVGKEEEKENAPWGGWDWAVSGALFFIRLLVPMGGGARMLLQVATTYYRASPFHRYLLPSGRPPHPSHSTVVFIHPDELYLAPRKRTPLAPLRSP
jgi:hypothetical protein